MQTLRKADGLAFGILTVGTVGSIIDATAKPRRTGAAKYGALAYYGLMGAAAIYRISRAAMPKSPSQRRLERLSQLNDQAETYWQQLQRRRRQTDQLVRAQYRNLKSAISKSS
jgi:hypothetical protein